jgi:hypothetical protein
LLLLFFSKKTILQQRGRRLLIPHTPDITITPFGVVKWKCPRIFLGHCRLSILDLPSAGHQPMHYKNDLSIVHNSKIYNYLLYLILY